MTIPLARIYENVINHNMWFAKWSFLMSTRKQNMLTQYDITCHIILLLWIMFSKPRNSVLSFRNTKRAISWSLSSLDGNNVCPLTEVVDPISLVPTEYHKFIHALWPDRGLRDGFNFIWVSDTRYKLPTQCLHSFSLELVLSLFKKKRNLVKSLKLRLTTTIYKNMYLYC